MLFYDLSNSTVVELGRVFVYLNQVCLQYSFARFKLFSFFFLLKILQNLQLYMHPPPCYIHRFTILIKITSDVRLKWPLEGNSRPEEL